jgi:hypothetical protein
MFQKKRLDGYYFCVRGFYILKIPVRVPYNSIYEMARAAGYKERVALGPILEWPKMFGFGSIGIEIENPSTADSNVIKMSQTYEMYEHRGPYKTIGQACTKIMKEKGRVKEMLNLYLDDPAKVAGKDCRTQILFRV